MTYVDRITETEFDARVTEIEKEFDVSLDDLGIEVTYCSHPIDVDEQMEEIRGKAIESLSREKLEEMVHWQKCSYTLQDRVAALAELKRRRKAKDTPAQILAKWEQGYKRDAQGAWTK